MEKKLYDLMDWAGIEELVYSEAGESGTPSRSASQLEEGLLIQAYHSKRENRDREGWGNEELSRWRWLDEGGFYRGAFGGPDRSRVKYRLHDDL